MSGSLIVPAITGNVIGGMFFGALLNPGQVAADRSAATVEDRPHLAEA